MHACASNLKNSATLPEALRAAIELSNQVTKAKHDEQLLAERSKHAEVLLTEKAKHVAQLWAEKVKYTELFLAEKAKHASQMWAENAKREEQMLIEKEKYAHLLIQTTKHAEEVAGLGIAPRSDGADKRSDASKTTENRVGDSECDMDTSADSCNLSNDADQLQEEEKGKPDIVRSITNEVAGQQGGQHNTRSVGIGGYVEVKLSDMSDEEAASIEETALESAAMDTSRQGQVNTTGEEVDELATMLSGIALAHDSEEKNVMNMATCVALAVDGETGMMGMEDSTYMLHAQETGDGSEKDVEEHNDDVDMECDTISNSAVANSAQVLTSDTSIVAKKTEEKDSEAQQEGEEQDGDEEEQEEEEQQQQQQQQDADNENEQGIAATLPQSGVNDLVCTDELPASNLELPPGYRSNLVYAIHAGDPRAMIKCLSACSKIDRSVLCSVRGGKVAPAKGRLPWSKQEAELSTVKRIDNVLIYPLNSYFTNEETSIHTLVFAVAARFGRVCVVSLLIDKYRNQVDLEYNSNEAIRMASRAGHAGIVKCLLGKYGVDPSANNNEAIRYASKYGHVHVVKLLLSHSWVDPSVYNNESIREASNNGNIEVVKLLLSDPRVDPSACHNQALRLATRNDHVGVVKLLLQDKRVDSDEAKSLIGKALKWADTCVLRHLLEDTRVVITNELLRIVDLDNSSIRVDALFSAADEARGIWPTVVSSDLTCASRKRGQLRNKLDGLELASSWVLLLCVKRIFWSRVAARVGDVLHEVCSEWLRFISYEIGSCLMKSLVMSNPNNANVDPQNANIGPYNAHVAPQNANAAADVGAHDAAGAAAVYADDAAAAEEDER